MATFFEVDFVEAGESGNGDAIALRYTDENDAQYVHVVDGGYANDGDKLIAHIEEYYGAPKYIDNVVLTHPDGDHAAGLKKVLEHFDVGGLWMNRPWNHIDALIPLFDYKYTAEGLRQRLRKDFPHTAALEDLAVEQEIDIYDALQGDQIGEFLVLAPSQNRYIQLIAESEKTPEEARKAAYEGTIFEKIVAKVKSVLADWGEESLTGDSEGTSSENEVSIVQFAALSGRSILLTGDAGVGALEEAYNYAVARGVALPGIDHFQVPHHGSRRNLSSDILDKWLGGKLAAKPAKGHFSAVVSANQKSTDHPKKAVIRALTHRGARLAKSKGVTRTSSPNAPARANWSAAAVVEYPHDMEE